MNVSVAATVAGIAAKDVIDTFVLDGYPEPLIKPHQALGLILDALVAKLSGVPAASVPGTIVIRDVHDAADRISIDVDGDGNRTGLTMNAPP